MTLDEALAALQEVRTYEPRQKSLATIQEILDSANLVIPPEFGDVAEAEREYGRTGGLIDHRLTKLKYDMEESGDELRVVYACLAAWGTTNAGALPQDLPALQLPAGIDPASYRLLGVPSTNGLAKDVALCMGRRLWIMDETAVNQVYVETPEIGRGWFNLPYAKYYLIPYGEYLARVAAGEQLKLDLRMYDYVPEVIVLMGNGEVRSVDKPRCAELLAKDAAARERLSLPPAPAGLLQEYFGAVDDRLDDLVRKSHDDNVPLW